MSKVEVAKNSQKKETQTCAVTPRPKSKGPNRGTPPVSPAKTDPKPPEPKKTGKGSGKGKEGKSEQKPEKRRQQCIPFYRGICKKGDQCNYEHQVDRDGEPIPVGPEILQKYDEAVKRFNDKKAQAKAKSARKGGVGVVASMIVLAPEEESILVASSAVHVWDDYYAMMNSETNAVIVPLHPNMSGEMWPELKEMIQKEDLPNEIHAVHGSVAHTSSTYSSKLPRKVGGRQSTSCKE